MFFFYFENVVLRRKGEEEKSLELLAHLDMLAFEFIFQRFTITGQILEEAKNFVNVKQTFFLEFGSEKQPEETIHRAMDATLDSTGLTKSMKEGDIL